ncbi:hypothetical protein ABZ079_29440 [Streptomyces sp. NPDC006314]|uniref:hypothetical protein n=1 Tax=Streptomyces sp. NPDC006314 TaxID=3154475 RepID=UPI0033B89F70
MGFNSESGLAVGTALQNFTIQDNPAASGQEVTASIVIVNSHEELMESMGMSFEGHGRYGFVSASAKARFSESSSFNSTSTFLVARCIVENPLRRGKNFQVSAVAQGLLDSLRFDEFKAAFGDSFVRGLQTGGEFYSVIRITSVSVAKQSELAATLQAEANGLIAGGGFSLAFSQANSSQSTRSEFSASMYQKAGTGSQSSPAVEIGEVIARFKAFPQIASTSAAAYEAEVASYNTLPLPVPTIEEQEAFLFALSDARERKHRYAQTRNDLDFALRHPEFFEPLPPADVLQRASDMYTKLINAVMEHAIRLSRGQITPPRLFDPAALTPPLTEPAPIPIRRIVTALPTAARLLQFQSLKCLTHSDQFGAEDEPFLLWNGERIWSGTMGDGDTQALNVVRLMTNPTGVVQLFDEDPDSQDDLLGSGTIRLSDEAGQVEFHGEGDYLLTYRLAPVAIP